MHIKSIIHRLGVPTLLAGLWEAIFTQAFDLGYYVAPLQGLPGRQIALCLFVWKKSERLKVV